MPKNIRALPKLSEEQIERFWSRVDKTPGQGPNGECWCFTGTKFKNGYGQFSVGKYPYLAHRICYFIHYGEDPGPFLVCHKCDNPPCCNPSHYFKGTILTNSQDRDQKGRGYGGDRHWTNHQPEKIRGSQNNFSKLTEEKVREIRMRCSKGETQASVGRHFGVSEPTIQAIMSRRNWGWLE